MERVLSTFVESAGYPAIFFLMALESACIPVPSEVVMVGAGFFVARGDLSFLPATAAGVLGNLAGSLAAYFLGRTGGRGAVERYGRLLRLHRGHLLSAEKWFGRYGGPAVFFSRMLPVVRTFISLPAGVGKMPVLPFSLYTITGSLPWNAALVGLGVIFGARWSVVLRYFHLATAVVLAIVVLGLVWVGRRRSSGGLLPPRRAELHPAGGWPGRTHPEDDEGPSQELRRGEALSEEGVGEESSGDGLQG